MRGRREKDSKMTEREGRETGFSLTSLDLLNQGPVSSSLGLLTLGLCGCEGLWEGPGMKRRANKISSYLYDAHHHGTLRYSSQIHIEDGGLAARHGGSLL